MTEGQYIKYKRTKLGWTQTDLGSRLGVTAGTVNKWETGYVKNIKRGMWSRILEVLCDDVSEVFMIDGQVTDKGVTSGQSNKIPIVGRIPAGVPISALCNVSDYIDFENDGENQYICLRVIGDSMKPEIKSGDLVIIKITSCFESGQICAVYVDDYDATLKRVKKNDDGTITLVPLNPAYQQRTYNSGEIQIAGVVVETRRKF